MATSSLRKAFPALRFIAYVSVNALLVVIETKVPHPLSNSLIAMQGIELIVMLLALLSDSTPRQVARTHPHNKGRSYLELYFAAPAALALGFFLGWIDLPHYREINNTTGYIKGGTAWGFVIIGVATVVWGLVCIHSTNSTPLRKNSTNSKRWNKIRVGVFFRLWGYFLMVVSALCFALLLVHYSWLPRS